MIPALLGMGGWLAKVAAVSVIPKVVQALKSALAAPAPSEVSSPKPDSPVKYTFDQLGSMRELVDSSGVVRADYRYSTYGERTKEAGDLESDWGYAGLFHHGPSGLDLATYRTYDPQMGRWISRDPLGEGVDYNLYRYCGNNPINNVDPWGLEKILIDKGDIFLRSGVPIEKYCEGKIFGILRFDIFYDTETERVTLENIQVESRVKRNKGIIVGSVDVNFKISQKFLNLGHRGKRNTPTRRP